MMHDPDRMLTLATVAMREGNLADKAIMALAKAAAKEDLDEEDTTILNLSIEYLNKVKDGYHWIENPLISKESRANAFSFETAAKAWSNSIESPVQFLEDIDSMIDTVKGILSNNEFNEQSLKRTISFFDRVFRHTIDKISALSQGPDIVELLDVK